MRRHAKTALPASGGLRDVNHHCETSRAKESGSTEASVAEILAATAHELRLPLSHIKGFVSSLLATDVEWNEETRSDFLVEIEMETDRLEELVESLLGSSGPNCSRAQGLDMEWTHPARVVEGAIHRVRACVRDRPLRLDVSPKLPCVEMHASQIERVVANLVQNAVKYSPVDSPIYLSATLTNAGELKFTVEDEGPGIPPEDRERIFEPYFRCRSDNHVGVKGYGLGLAICQSIVKAHAGRIEVSDRPKGGACFCVFLPAH